MLDGRHAESARCRQRVLTALNRAVAEGAEIAVSGPAERWTEERMRAFSERLLNACAELSVLFDDSSALPRGY
jgi:DNA-binding IclR family transcriptional regulator